MKHFRTYDLALEFYRQCQAVVTDNTVIKKQFERASLSVVLNIAEGAGRTTSKEKANFYSIALGSLKETRCILQIQNELQLEQKADKLAEKSFKKKQK